MIPQIPNARCHETTPASPRNAWVQESGMRAVGMAALLLASAAVSGCATSAEGGARALAADEGTSRTQQVARDQGAADILKAIASDEANEAALAAVLAHPRRDGDRARDGARNPAQTLALFDVRPTHTVVEALPGGGWYTRILLPYVAEQGAYYGANYPVSVMADLFGDSFTEERRASVENFPTAFADTTEDQIGFRPDGGFLMDEAPEALYGQVDRVIAVRALHNLARFQLADDAANLFYDLLRPGGLVGVVQHRAPAEARVQETQGASGYLREQDVIDVFVYAGFEHVGSSEVNANPLDTADHEGGVWALPPSRRGGGDEATRARLDAIGESDRMTLVFRKPN